MNLKDKAIVFIPPDGKIIDQDFALTRIINYFHKIGIKTYLLSVGNFNQHPSIKYSAEIIILENKSDIIRHLEDNSYDLIFSRSWMHRYMFAAEIAKKFNNVISYIKDWHDFPKDQYTFVYDTESDVEAIGQIFQHSKIVLSHYSSNYTDILASRYGVGKNKFHFFPEYAAVSNFAKQQNKKYDLLNIRLLMAGGGANCSLPNNIIPAKAFFNTLIQLSDQRQL